MPSSYTPSLRLTLPVTGELAGTWGSTVNTGVTTLAEAAIAGTAAVAMTDADYTLTVSNGATDQARNMFITLTGTLTVSRNVICPAVSKLYVVTNSTTGSQNIVFKTSAGAGITVANGQRKMVYCNGTDVLDATTSFTSIIFDAGTVSAPSITFAGSTNTGFWRPAVSTVALSTAGLERLRVDSSGNVGIGTASPTAVLDVRGASYVIGAIGTRVTDTSAGNGFEVVPSTTNNVLSYNRTSSTYLPIRWRAGIQSWEVDNTERMRLDASGNLGIGTAAPEQRLHLSNTGSTSVAIKFTNSAASAGIISYSSDSMLFYTANAIRATIDTSGNLGIGVSPATRIDVQAVTTTGSSFGLRVAAGTNASDYSARFNNATGTTLALLDGLGNLGIGTSSPASTLDVRTSTGATIIAGRTSNVGASSQPGALNFTAPNASGSARTWAGIRAVVGTATAGSESASIIFSNQVAGAYTDTLTLDSSGNLGLGVTPSAWGSNNKAIDVGSIGGVAADAATMRVANNTYIDSGSTVRYKTTAAALLYGQNPSVGHFWSTAPSGTAGNPITFTQAMTLDASGNLGIGTSSPTARITLRESAASATALNMLNRNGTQQWALAVDAATVDDKILGFIDQTNSVVRMALTDTGNLGLGVTPSAWGSMFRALDIGPGVGAATGAFGGTSGGAYVAYNCFYNASAQWIYKTTGSPPSLYANEQGLHKWYTAPSGTAGTAFTFTQAMTLDASGNLLVGGTSVLLGATGRGNITLNGSSNALLAFGNGGVNSGYIYSASDRLEIDAASTRFIQFNTNGAERARLDSSGNLGLGVTPSAWGGTAKGFEIAGNAGVSGRSSIDVGVNFYNNGTNNIYIATAVATRYTQVTGEHRWLTAPSGTAGTAITFTQAMTLDSSGNLGIGTNAPSTRLQAYDATSATIRATSGVSANLDLTANATDVRVGTPNGVPLLFLTGGSERARIDSSGNLGIGTSSPIVKLAIQDTERLEFGGSSGVMYSQTLNAARTATVESRAYASFLSWWTGASGSQTEKMRLDSSGNLGLGVTPSAWGSTFRAFQVARSSFWTPASGGSTYIDTNAFYDSVGYKYIANGFATEYAQVTDGSHRWYTAPSGTAGTAITFTQAMTLDSSGNLGIGTSSPANKLHVVGTGTFAQFSNNADANFNIKAATALMTVGTGVPGASLAFMTADVERARIDSSGNFLVGKTTAGESTGGNGTTIFTGVNAEVAVNAAGSTSGTTGLALYSSGAAAFRFYVNMAGTVFATSTTISAISDQRLKENIRDLDVGLNAVLSLKPRVYDWKEGKGKDIKGDRGFIAQEFEQVFPDLIDEWKDPADEGESPYKSVRPDLIPVLVKAIQEQQALITSLAARVAALEAV